MLVNEEVSLTCSGPTPTQTTRVGCLFSVFVCLLFPFCSEHKHHQNKPTPSTGQAWLFLSANPNATQHNTQILSDMANEHNPITANSLRVKVNPLQHTLATTIPQSLLFLSRSVNLSFVCLFPFLCSLPLQPKQQTKGTKDLLFQTKEQDTQRRNDTKPECHGRGLPCESCCCWNGGANGTTAG